MRGNSSYLTDINGVPTHYYGYLPFTSLIILFVLVFGALREEKPQQDQGSLNTQTK